MEGGMLNSIYTGLAGLGFVLLTTLTAGIWILAYAVMLNMARHGVPSAPAFGAYAGTGGRLGVTLAAFVLAFFSAISFCLCVAAIVSLATTGAIFGWVVGGSIPVWASILILLVQYSVP